MNLLHAQLWIFSSHKGKPTAGITFSHLCVARCTARGFSPIFKLDARKYVHVVLSLSSQPKKNVARAAWNCERVVADGVSRLFPSAFPTSCLNGVKEIYITRNRPLCACTCACVCLYIYTYAREFPHARYSRGLFGKNAFYLRRSRLSTQRIVIAALESFSAGISATLYYFAASKYDCPREDVLARSRSLNCI